MLDDHLKATLHMLMQDCAKVEDDTVLIKLHSEITSIFKSFEPEIALSWCHRSGLWTFMVWGSSCYPGKCCSSLSALALKCVATLASSEIGFEEIKNSKILDCISTIMQLSSKQPSSGDDSNLDNALHNNNKNDASSQNGHSTNDMNLNGAASGQPNNDHKTNDANLDSSNDFSTINSSVLHAVLSVVLALLEHEPGRDWVQHHQVPAMALLPCMRFSSVFVQRAAAVALVQILRSSQQQCEQIFPLLKEGCEVSLRPPMLVSLMTQLLDGLPLGQCPEWLCEELVALHGVLRERLSSLSASTSLLRSLFDLRLRLLAQQHVSLTLAAGTEGASTESAAALIFRVLSDMIVLDGKLVSPSGWAQALTLASDWSAALTAAGRPAAASGAVARLCLHLLLLPVLAAQRANVEGLHSAVIAELAGCASAGSSDIHLQALEEWLAERARSSWDLATAGACLRAAAAATPAFSAQLCMELLRCCGWRALLSVDHTSTPPTTLADESTVVVTVELLQAIIKRDVTLVPMGEVVSALSDVYSSRNNSKKRALAVLECLLLYLQPAAVAEAGLPQPFTLKLIAEEGLCHTAWEVRDSALQVLTAALQHEEYHAVVYSECVMRSTEALLDSQESFVQCGAALLLAAAHARRLPGWEWGLVHTWCVRVCCSEDAVAGCESDAVAAAAWSLLRALHAQQRCNHSTSSDQSNSCVRMSLHHAQRCCVADSDTLRLAALQYLAGHIHSLLEMADPSAGKSIEASVERCCADGSAWCVMRCMDDTASSVREEANKLRGVLLDALRPNKSGRGASEPPLKLARCEQPGVSEVIRDAGIGSDDTCHMVEEQARSEKVKSGNVDEDESTHQLKEQRVGQVEDKNTDSLVKKLTSDVRNLEPNSGLSPAAKRSLNDGKPEEYLNTNSKSSKPIDHPGPLGENQRAVLENGLLDFEPKDSQEQVSSVKNLKGKSSALLLTATSAQNVLRSDSKSEQDNPGEKVPLLKKDSKEKTVSDLNKKFTCASGCAPDSSEAEIVLEEVLDFPDLQTLDDLRRSSDLSTPHLLADQNQAPAVSSEKFSSFLRRNSSATENFEVQKEKEFRELLEDIQLQLQREKKDSTADLSLVFGEPSHLIMDCY